MIVAKKLSQLYRTHSGRSSRASVTPSQTLDDTSKPELPPEIWLLVLSYASQEFCYGSRLLSLVCKTFHDLITRSDLVYSTVEAHGVKRLQKLLSRLSSEELSGKHIYHLFLSSQEPSIFGSSSGNDEQVTSSTRLMTSILATIHHSYLRTLVIFLPRTHNAESPEFCDSLLSKPYPWLLSLTVHGPLDPSFFDHHGTLPNLRILDIAGYRSLPYTLDTRISNFAPTLQRLRISNVEGVDSVLPRILQGFAGHPFSPIPRFPGAKVPRETAFPDTLQNITLTLCEPDPKTPAGYLNNEAKHTYETIARQQRLPTREGELPKLIVLPASGVRRIDMSDNNERRRFEEIRKAWRQC